MGKDSKAAICYIIPVFGGIAFLVLSKENFVRFHALQSIIFWIITLIIYMVLGSFNIPLVPALVYVLSFILWLMLIYKSWQGEEWELPVVGKIPRKLLARLS